MRRCFCPIEINTGALMKHFRKMEHMPEFEEAALEIAKEWGEVERLVRLAIGAADVVQQLTGTGLLTGVTDIARSVMSSDLIPSVPGPIPHASSAELPSTVRKGVSAAYFPACVNRIFGREVNSPKTQVCQKFSSPSRPAQESRFGSRTMYGVFAAPPCGVPRATRRAVPIWLSTSSMHSGAGVKEASFPSSSMQLHAPLA
jgi:hypothetical protein